MKKCAFLIMYISSFLIVTSVNLFAQISLPARVGGSVTIDGVQLTQTTDTGYTFTVTSQDGTSYDPSAEDTDGVNNNNWYTINIPIYDSNNQPGGAQSGEAALIHVFLSGNELDVNSPANGQITVGEPGSITQIDVVAQSRTPTPTQTPTPSTPTPVPTPVTSPNPTVCEVDRITVSKTSLKLKRKKSGTVTVAVTGDDGCAVEGETVTATINAAGKKRISVSPTSASTDENGQESFTVTARKTGNARITFKAGRVKKSITVKIKK